MIQPLHTEIYWFKMPNMLFQHHIFGIWNVNFLLRKLTPDRRISIWENKSQKSLLFHIFESIIWIVGSLQKSIYVHCSKALEKSWTISKNNYICGRGELVKKSRWWYHIHVCPTTHIECGLTMWYDHDGRGVTMLTMLTTSAVTYKSCWYIWTISEL